MAEYTVTKVRKEWAGSGEERHEHIEGVCTTADVHYGRQQVVDSIDAGNSWRTYADGDYATIHTLCSASSFLDTFVPG